MTTRATRELIAQARREGSPRAWPLGVHYKPLLLQLAAALEKAERERDRLDEAFDRDLPWRYDEVEAQRNQLAAALADAEQRAEDAEREMHARELHHFEEEERAAGLAAVLEEVRAEVTRTPPSGFGYYLPSGNGLRTILASAPADALREVKAAAWDEGYFRRMDDYPFDPEERDNPYRKEQS